MRTAFIVDDGSFLINLNQIIYGAVRKQDEGDWKAVIYLRDSKEISWTYSTKDGAQGKLKELYRAANELSLTEVLG